MHYSFLKQQVGLEQLQPFLIFYLISIFGDLHSKNALHSFNIYIFIFGDVNSNYCSLINFILYKYSLIYFSYNNKIIILIIFL